MTVNNTDFMSAVLQRQTYIVYPPEIERPPVGTKAEIDAYLAALIAKEAKNKPQDAAENNPNHSTGENAFKEQKRNKWFGIF